MSQNALTVLSGMKISTLAGQSKYAGQELGAGIAAPFAVIGYKGGKWSIRHRGNTTILERRDAQGRSEGPVPFLDLVILFAASHHSKVYYAKQYSDGDDDVPDCWSTNGVVPDQAAPKKQSPTCANCRWNEFGSRMNQATGAKGKACADTRRMAVVPARDIPNQLLGGPMLLRVPPASLGSVGQYSDMLKANSIPYSAIATRVGFDPQEAYPKMTFEPFEALSDDQMRQVIEAQKHPLVERIVQEQIENMVAQVGSEQGQPATPQSQAVEGGGVKQQTNGAGNGTQPVTTAVTPPAGPAPVHNPFANVPQGGPSFQGPQTAAQGQTAPPVSQPAPAAAAPAPAQPLSPEQLRIKELEEQLAAAKATPATRPTRKRTQPVAPQAQAEPTAALTGGPAKSEAQISAELPGTPIVPPEPGQGEEDGSGSGAAVPPSGDPALASISARLSKILS